MTDDELYFKLADIEDRLDKIEKQLNTGINERILPILQTIVKDIRDIKTYR